MNDKQEIVFEELRNTAQFNQNQHLSNTKEYEFYEGYIKALKDFKQRIEE